MPVVAQAGTDPTVFHTLTRPGGTPMADEVVHIRLLAAATGEGEGFIPADQQGILSEYKLRTDSTGKWSLTLTPNAVISPDNTTYQVIQPGITGGKVTETFIVPNGGGPYWLGDILAAAPVGLPQYGLDVHEADEDAHPDLFARRTGRELSLSLTDAAANIATMQAAINAANVDYLAGNGITRIFAPEGRWPIRRNASNSYSVDVKEGVELFGAGEGRTVFVVEAHNLTTETNYQSRFRVKGTSGAPLKDIYLHDFTVDGNKAAMTGTATANTGDTIDYQHCTPSVVTERVTVINATADAFDVDDSNGNLIRFCTARGANGYGFHNSENNVGVVLVGNYAENCGHFLNRGGFDQFTTASKGVYLGNRAKDCYQNYAMNGSGAVFYGNVDLGGSTIANGMTGVAAGIDPVDGKLLLHSATTGIRISDQTDLAQTKRWLLYALGGGLRFFSQTLGGETLTMHDTGNVGFGSTAFAGGQRVLALADATVVPSSSPSSGVILYIQDGVLKTRSPAGVITALVPPTPAISEDAIRTAFRPTGFQFENFSRQNASWVNINPLQSGRLNVYAVYLPADMVISSLAFYSATTAAATPTNQWFALYNTSLALLRQTADDGATAWAANTRKSLALTSSYTVPSSGLYYVGIMVAATTVPTLLGIGGPVATHVNGLAPVIAGSSTTGLTTTAPNPAAALTTTSPIPYITGS